MSLKLRATGRDRRPIDASEVRRALTVLAEDGVEIRGIPSGRSVVLPASDLNGLGRAAEEFSDDDGIYYTLNPIPPDLDHPARVDDVKRRRNLLIDIDPVKGEGGKDASATDAEKAAALELAAKIRDWLTGQGWPPPVEIDSCNGGHLVYRIDLPNDKDAQEVIRTVLYTLAKKFDGGRGRVDKAVHNASRIAKLPGTWGRKGPDTPERPHRMARLLSVPDVIRTVTLEQLRRITVEEPPAADDTAADDTAFILRTLGDPEKSYVAAAVKAECEFVRSGKHKNLEGRNNALNAAAFALGQLVAGGVLDRAEAESELANAAEAAGLDRDDNCGPRGITATINSGLESGFKKPRGVPDGGQEVNGTNGRRSAPGTAWGVYFGGQAVIEGTNADLEKLGNRQLKTAYQKFEVHTLRELLAMEFPDPDWAIPGILSEGLNMLVGSPKMGKSMLALNLALTVAGGGKALGNIQTIPGDVLYLSLEDKARRVQARARKMVRELGEGAADRLSVVTKWPRMDRGGLTLLEKWVQRVQSPRLVVIDVLGKFRPLLRERGSQYEQDSQHLYAIKEYCDEHRLTGLANHHTRKAASGKSADKAADEFEEISGTQGLGGACDGIIMLRRSRRSNEAFISVTGRDEAEQRLALRFDPITLTWTNLGTAEEHLSGEFQKRVVDFLRKRPGALIFVSEIADRLEADDSAVRTTLYRLEEKGIVRRQGKAWSYPATDPDADVEGF